MARKTKFGNNLLQADYIQTVALGPTNALPVDADVGKVVKMTGDTLFELCADGDEIHGMISAIEQGPTDDGYQVASVFFGGGSGTVEVSCAVAPAVGDLVVADAAGGCKTGVPTRHRWECVALRSSTIAVLKKV